MASDGDKWLAIAIVARFEFLMEKRGDKYAKDTMRDCSNLLSCQLDMEAFLELEDDRFIREFEGIRKQMSRGEGVSAKK